MKLSRNGPLGMWKTKEDFWIWVSIIRCSVSEMSKFAQKRQIYVFLCVYVALYTYTVHNTHCILSTTFTIIITIITFGSWRRSSRCELSSPHCPHSFLAIQQCHCDDEDDYNDDDCNDDDDDYDEYFSEHWTVTICAGQHYNESILRTEQAGVSHFKEFTDWSSLG